MNGYFKQVTPPKAISNSESGEYLLNKLTQFKKNGCKIFVIEYDPIDNRCMASVWDLFINLGDMERILGIRVKVQVIPSPGECDPSSITKQHWYCKHHVNCSSKVWYIQHKNVINLDHSVTLAMTDGSCPPRGISTLCQEYFDLKYATTAPSSMEFLFASSLQPGDLRWIPRIWCPPRKQSPSLPRLPIAHRHGGIGTGWKRAILKAPY